MPSFTSAFGEPHCGSYTSAFGDSEHHGSRSAAFGDSDSSSDGYESPFSNDNITHNYFTTYSIYLINDIFIG